MVETRVEYRGVGEDEGSPRSDVTVRRDYRRARELSQHLYKYIWGCYAAIERRMDRIDLTKAEKLERDLSSFYKFYVKWTKKTHSL